MVKRFGNLCGNGLANFGLDDWKHISERLKSSRNHLLVIEKWIGCETKIKLLNII